MFLLLKPQHRRSNEGRIEMQLSVDPVFEERIGQAPYQNSPRWLQIGPFHHMQGHDELLYTSDSRISIRI